VVGFTPQPLYSQGKSLWYPLDRRLRLPQSWSGRGGEEKNSQSQPGLEIPIIQPAAQFMLILSYHLRLGPSNPVFPTDFPTNILYPFLISCVCATSLTHIIFFDLISLQPPIQSGPGALSPGVRWPGLEADHSPPPSAEVKNAWRYIPFNTFSWRGT